MTAKDTTAIRLNNAGRQIKKTVTIKYDGKRSCQDIAAITSDVISIIERPKDIITMLWASLYFKRATTYNTRKMTAMQAKMIYNTCPSSAMMSLKVVHSPYTGPHLPVWLQ